MKSSMQILNKSEIIEKKVEQLFQSLDAKKIRGEIKSEAEMLQKLFSALSLFYNSLGKPSYTFRQALDTPVSSHYIGMIKEFMEDSQLIVDETKIMNDLLSQAFSSIEIERQMLQAQIRYLVKKINDLKNNPKIDNGAVYFDSFTNVENFDKSMAHTPAEVNIVEGLVTLALVNSEDHTPQMDVTIKESSTGLPGNTHVISSISGAMKFEGEDNLNINPYYIKDQNLDTWFDFELFKLSSSRYDEIEGYGIAYKEGRKWISEDNKMILEIQLELESPKMANWISMSPFVPEHKGARACFITSIVVNNGKGTKQSIVNFPVYFDDDMVFTFQMQEFKYIDIRLEQTLPYSIDIGHFKTIELDNNNRDVFRDNTGYENRIEGKLPTVNALGVEFDPRSRMYKQPSTKMPIEIKEELTKTMLFNITSKHDTLTTVEVLDASRFHIGIKNINVMNKEFVEESQYITKPITTIKPISEVFIDISAIIPNGYKNDSIECFISMNHGQEWHSIVPISMGVKGKIKYLINSHTPTDVRNDNLGYIDTENEAFTVRAMIILKRDKDNPYSSPVIKDIKIVTMFEGDM